MGMIITGTLLKTLNTSFSALFSGGMGQVEGQLSAIATKTPSSTKTNEYGWLGELPDMREWIGDRVAQQLKGHGYAIENKDFELTVEVKKTDIEDDNIGGYSMRFDQTGMGEKVVEDLIIKHGASRVVGELLTGPTRYDLAIGLKKRFEERKIRVRPDAITRCVAMPVTQAIWPKERPESQSCMTTAS